MLTVLYMNPFNVKDNTTIDTGKLERYFWKKVSARS